MHTFLAKLLFHIDVENHVGPAQFDEQLRLVIANDPEAAWQKANHLGLADEEEFTSQNGSRIFWRFVTTLDVFPLSAAGDGAVLITATHEVTQGARFLDEMMNRSRLAREWHEQSATQPA